jgi:tetratricopeptide (TPR) repeat protein
LFLADKNIPSAVAEVEKLVQLKPENTYYLYLLATHLQELGLTDKSLLLFNEILRIDPSDARASIAINQINANPSDKTAYLKSLQNIMTQKGGDVDAKIFEILPYLKYINGSDTTISKLVLETCSLLVIGHPQNAKSNALYGDALKLAGQFSDAIIYYQKSISIDKRVFAVFDELLQLLYHSGEFAAMKKLAEETIDYYPNQSKAVIWYAISLIYTKQYQQALAALDQASLMGSGNAELMGLIYAWEARAKIFQKQFKESVESYRKAVQISGGSQDVLNMALYDMTDYLQTRADALSLATSIQQGGNVTSPEIILLFSRLDASLEKSATAKEKLLKISNNQLTPEGLEYKADVLFLLGDREAAVSIWELAIKEGGLAFRIASKIKDNRVFP